jgi:hypothetical protein
MTADSPIVLVAVPCFDAERVRACGRRGLLFDAKIGERVLVHRTIQPLLDACRVLIAEGCTRGPDRHASREQRDGRFARQGGYRGRINCR